MSAVRYSRKARSDLREIWTYTAEHWGEVQADRYIARFHTAFWSLASDPTRARKAHEIHPEYWRYGVGSHVVFFKLIEEGIEVVRVLHQRQDFRQHFWDVGRITIAMSTLDDPEAVQPTIRYGVQSKLSWTDCLATCQVSPLRSGCGRPTLLES